MQQRSHIIVHWIGLAVVLMVLPVRGGDVPPLPAVEWKAGDRVLVLAPHPGDETIGCGATIRQLTATGIPVRVAFLTCGEHSQWSLQLYRERLVVNPDKVSLLGPRRMQEARAAAGELGLPPESLLFLGYPDFGTLNIWCAHWAEAMPFRSMLTRTRQVSYAEALHPGAPYKGEVLLADLKDVIRDFRPTCVLVSHPADQHPDHQALYLFTRVALWDLSDLPEPVRRPYLIHYTQWPEQDGQSWLLPPADLAGLIEWHGVAAGPDQTEARDRALAAHQTDEAFSSGRLKLFARQSNMYGDFADADLSGKPLVLEAGASPLVLPEELTAEEKDRHVGIESCSAVLEGRVLQVDLRLNRALQPGMGASVYVFGYRPDRAFEHMPKLQVCLQAFSVEVLDQARLCSPGLVLVRRSGADIRLRIPLEALGSPDRLFAGARTYLHDVPLDWMAWRVLRIPAAEDSSSTAEQ